MVLAIMFPEHRFILIDSSRKKTLFLKTVSREIGLNIEIINARVEGVKFSEQKLMDLVVARGFAALSELLDYSKPLLKQKGAVLSLKGKDYKNELKSKELESLVINEISIESKWKELSEKLNNKVLLKMER